MCKSWLCSCSRVVLNCYKTKKIRQNFPGLLNKESKTKVAAAFLSELMHCIESDDRDATLSMSAKCK